MANHPNATDGSDPERRRTDSGIEIKPVYTPADLAGWDPEEKLGAPGAFPFTRGVHAGMYRRRLWTMRQYAGFGTAESTNERFKFLLGAGLSMFGVMAYAWINETLGDRKGIYLGVYVMSIALGLGLAGLTVAVFLPLAPDWRTYYLVAGALALVPMAALAVFLPRGMGVPLRSMEEQIEQNMGRAELYRDLPRGRKHPGWKKEFLARLSDAAKDLGDISEEEILKTVRAYRRERRIPEITVDAES